MQIYYCDACGIRVNNSELLPGGDKVFCQACAAKQGAAPAAPPQRATPTGSVVLHQRPKTDGQAIPSPVRGATAQRQPSPAFGSGHSIPTQRAYASGERPRIGQTGPVPRPASASTRNTGSKPNDPTLIYAGAGAGAMLVLVLVFFVMRGSPETPSEPKVATKPGTQIEPRTPVAPVVAPVTPPTPPAPVNKPPEPTKPDQAIDDIRERAARREYDAVLRRVRDAGNDVIAARRSIHEFIRRYRSTQAGQEALAQAAKMAQVHARTADVPSAPQPGLKVQVFERPGDWEEIRNRNLASLKKLKDLTLDKIDMPNRKAVESTFGRPEYVAAIVTGYIEVPADGEYYLAVNSDDASFLFVGDWRVSENDGSHAVSEAGDTVPLKKGKHRIRILYSQGQGEATLQFYWSGPGISKQIVPPQALSHDP